MKKKLFILGLGLLALVALAWPAFAQDGGATCTGGCYGSATTCQAACNGKPCIKVGAPECSWYAYKCCTGSAATATPKPTPTVALPTATPKPQPTSESLPVSEGIYNPRDFGAIGDGQSHILSDGMEADGKAIQAALDEASRNGGGVVALGRGLFVINRPLLIPYTDDWGRAGITLRGTQGGYTTTIRKVGHDTLGNWSRQAGNGRMDSFDVDAVLMIDHPDGAINRHVAIESLHLWGDKNVVGIYAPRMSYSLISDVRVSGCETAYLGYQSVLSHIERLYGEGLGAGRGAGFVLADDGGHSNSSTSLSMATVYMQNYRVGYSLYRLFYSSLNALAMDHCGDGTEVGIAYEIENSQGVVFNGLGAEDVRGVTLRLNDTTAMVNGFFGYDLRGFSSDYGTLQVEGGRVALNACAWPPLVESNGQHNVKVTDGAEVVTQACAMPSGGAE